MSYKINMNLGLSMGVLTLLVFTVVVGGYYITQVKDAADYNQKQIQTIKDNQDVFVKTWLDSQKSKFRVDNATIALQLEQEKQLLNLSRTNDAIIKTQLENQHKIINISDISHEQETQLLNLSRGQQKIFIQQLANEKNLQGNLTNHRIIANLTYKEILDNQKAVEAAQNNTEILLKFLTDNFGEKSGYLEKENFQYNQANETYTIMKENNGLLKEQNEILIKLLNNNTLGR